MLDFNKQTCNADRRPRCIATLPKVQKLLTEARAKHACNADLNASLVIKKRGVRAVLNNEVHIKIPKKVAFSKKSARRAGTVRSDASASKPAERVSAISAQKPVCSSSVKQETPTTTAATVWWGEGFVL